MSRKTPFNEFTAGAIPPAIVLGKRPPIHSEWNSILKVVMAQCWDQNPMRRPLVREVRANLEGISQDRFVDYTLCHRFVSLFIPAFLIYDSFFSSYSDGGINTPASIYSSVSSGGTDNDIDSDSNIPNASYAPKSSVTLVFTDVENATQLWEADPRVMMLALKQHNEVIRKLLREFGGYEVKSEGDAFMIVFADPFNAVSFSLSAQLSKHFVSSSFFISNNIVSLATSELA